MSKITEYDTTLQALYEKLSRKAKVNTMLSSLKSQLAELKAEKQHLAAMSAKEQMDVDRLEKLSLSSFFYALMNQKAEKLEKEKAEAYAASVKYTAVVRQIESIEDEIVQLQAELSELADIEAEYEKTFSEKTAALKALNPECFAEIQSIKGRIFHIATQSKEIDEAHALGQSIIFQIFVIEDELNSAESWGTWDLYGGGLISAAVKHSHLDEAQELISELQGTLRRYHTELSDVTIQADIQAQVEGFLRFADYFFDGLYVDRAVLDHIHCALNQISKTRSEVYFVQNQLEEMKINLLFEAERLKAQLSDIVLKA